MKVLVSVLVLCVAAARQDDCTAVTCGDCMQHPGCVWCAAPEILGSAERCLARASAEPAWCPTQHRLDRSDVQLRPLGLRDLTQHPEARVSPDRVDVLARTNHVDLTFQLVDYAPEDNNNKVNIWDSSNSQLDTIESVWTPVESSDSWRKIYNVTVNLDVSAYVGCSDGLRDVAVLKVGVVAEGASVNVTLRRDCRGCECDDTEKVSDKCSGRGTLDCGGCRCQRGWTGIKCEKEQCDSDQTRGDQAVNACREPGADKDCSGAGSCRCGRCECGSGDSVGDFCRDLCGGTAECARCRHLSSHVTERVIEGVKIDQVCSHECTSEMAASASYRGGANCSVAVADGCLLYYDAARAGSYVDIHLQYDNCSLAAGNNVGGGGGIVAIAGGGGRGAALLGAVLGGVLGAAAVAAAAAALFWHLRGSGGRDPFAETQYEEMPPTANQGENPLYKPPVTSYNNPLYRVS